MTDKNVRLTRRKVLGALGVAGAGAALGGAGTAALFSDEEQFENNRIVAGSLDLKVDWEEHYSYPQIYGFNDPTTGLDVNRSEPQDNSEEYQALPDPQNPAVWIHQEDLSDYMDNTSIEAYPDVGDDGIQDDFNTQEIGDVCADGADTDEDLNPVEGLRTNNADTFVDDSQAPLVNLQDVKPGDFGELTLSFHLCNNPGYIWLNGELVEASENDVTEPEGESDNEDEGVVELLDEIEATVWYDGDCDNVLDLGEEGEEGQPADVMLVIDRSGSMDDEVDKFSNTKSGGVSLVNALGPNDQVGLVSFESNSTLNAGLTSDHNSVNTEINNLSADGGTTMGPAITAAQDELVNGANARSGARKIMIVLGDGAASDDPTDEADSAKTAGTEIFTIAYGNPGSTAVSTLQDMASDPQADHYFEADVSQIETLLQSLGGSIGTAGEQVITRGSLRDILTELADGDGIPLDAEPGSEGRSCYPGLQTSCVGLAWHLPAEVGNEVQTDSVSFNLGFYAEQCRNNPQPGTTGNT